MANHGKGIVLDSRDNDKDKNVSSVVVYNEDENELVIFALNRNADEGFELETVVNGFEPKAIVEHVMLHEENLKATNQIKHDAVIPKSTNNSTIKNGTIISSVPSASWNMIRIKL
jgi:alpha-N-arabinofuranosidase